MIENASFLYKTAISEVNVNINRIVSKRGFASDYFIFWKCCFSLRTSYKELLWSTNGPNVHIHTFRKPWNFIWGWFDLKRKNQEFLLFFKSLNKHSIQFFTKEFQFKSKTKVKKKWKKNEKKQQASSEQVVFFWINIIDY